jgi:hypothetical protein
MVAKKNHLCGVETIVLGSCIWIYIKNRCVGIDLDVDTQYSNHPLMMNTR